MTQLRDRKTPIAMSPRLLLAATTNWPTAARLAGAFARLSWRVEVLAPAGTPACASRFVHARQPYSALDPLGSLAAAVARSAPDLVIPCDDRACAQLIALHAQAVILRRPDVAGLIARSLGTPQDYETLTTRSAFIAAAAALGIAVPRTRAIANDAEFDAALAEIGLPAVIKSDGSWGGDGVAIAYSREEARALFRRLSRPVSPVRSALRSLRRRDAHHLVAALAPSPPRLSMQALVTGRPATTTFAAWEGTLLAAVHLDVAVATGETAPASVVRRIHDPAMERAARRLARRFGLSGLHGLDFIRGASGAVHLIEINPRATQTAALALGEGRDLAAALAERATGYATAARTPAIDNDLVALFPQEWCRDPQSPYLAVAHHDVPWGDPALVRALLAQPRRTAVWQWLMRTRPALPSLRPGNHPAIASER
jgi:hypothetical protein